MVFNPNSRESCDYYNVDFDTKRKLTDEEIEHKNYEEQRHYEDSIAKPLTKNLVARSGHGSEDYFPQQSRDYALSHTIPCECILCPANKNSYCEVPSLIKINPKGQCRTGLAFVEQNAKIAREPDTVVLPKNRFTPEWFYNRWNSNCPHYKDKLEVETNLLNSDFESVPGRADWSNDVRRVHEEKGII